MPKAQGRITPLLAAILRNKEARQRLRLAIMRGEDFTFESEGVSYRISTSNETERENGAVEAPQVRRPAPAG